MRLTGVLLGLSLLGGIVAAGIAFPAAIGLGLVANDASDSVGSVSTDVLDQPLPQTTIVTDNAGNTIAQLFVPDQNRRSVTSDEISPAMKAAIVAVEDRRFYQHQGVDWQGTVRAVVTNSVSGSIEQGASTLTQQYVKNYLLYVDAQTETERLKATEQTPARKLKEAQIALQLEQSLSKDEILTRYLNIVPFGNGAAGISSAARTYFGVTPADLTVPQAALLAGMVRSTTATDPVQNPQAAADRRNLVIQQMLEQQMIDRTQADAALAEGLGIAQPLNTQANGCIGAGPAGFFCQYVQEYLAEAGFSTEQLRRGGYTIQTTLDRGVLDAMQASLTAEVPPDQPDVANVMATVRPGTDRHEVLAMGSSRVYGLDGDALETSYGLPYIPVPLGAGSVYKTFTAATALEKGLGINYQLSVPPSGYASPIYVDGGGRPLPVQNSGNYSERLSLSDALAQSPNTAFVKLMEFTGVPDVVDMAVRLGMRSLATERFVDPNTGQPTDRSIAEVTKAQRQASFTLGVSPTSVLELSNVGATLASGGMWCPPTPIASITDSVGNPVPVTEAPCEQVVDPGLANAMMTAMSKDDLPGGTAGAAARQVGWDRPMAGKTGTTQANKSAAFLGVVPELSGAVITYDNDNRPDALCDGAGSPFACTRGNIFGGKTPAETWFGTVAPLLEGQPVTPLPAVQDRYLEGGAESRVPDVVGDGENDARATLESAGWIVTIREQDNASSPGTVIGQSPRGTALPGETIVLTVSTGEVPPPPAPPGDEPPAEGEDDSPPADDGGDDADGG
ncbi:transglycosylase domain-containing protein [Pseudonocardia abyssalis]|uniref:Penicillin-binding protein n=1 Tax=Pseudonocardia abyssalis TaxID=2792008 RepID=A0ABS6URL4_9PSEU|nr:transglycosylase domain-containing protein [Pseudonocardia abyssalis]MBW0114339.1 penicillin-binding protein [Pseudonocardia abyssalis]MBW0134877.1 penicillin-binding protein [Pseudonocardia abyssalis]